MSWIRVPNIPIGPFSELVVSLGLGLDDRIWVRLAEPLNGSRFVLRKVRHIWDWRYDPKAFGSRFEDIYNIRTDYNDWGSHGIAITHFTRCEPPEFRG